MEENFTWVQTHKELVQFLATKREHQKELIDLLKSIGINEGFKDKDLNDNSIDLEEIDPFTFFFFLYKHGTTNRLRYLQKIAQKLNLYFPKDDCGIPTAQAQRVWLFPYKKNRMDKEVSRLWDFFESILNDTITDEIFENILSIKYAGKAKITEALFDINPEKYFPINGPSKVYLNSLNIDYNFQTFTEYLKVLDNIKRTIQKPFYEISYEAWNWKNKSIDNPILELIENTKVNQMNHPLNVIFYGPPGTGKTYKTILRAAEILENRPINSYKEAINIFKKNLHDRVEMITFHQNYGYEDFIQGIKPDVKNEKNELHFQIKDGIFKVIADLALKKSKQNYVIIIDEINRANISKVFGELITLIEVDKRSHGENPMSCTLPSGEEFTVPSNLYIIGTMNTADKSIALLDIALRRRFEFEAMYPDYTVDGLNEIEILKKLNNEIIRAKGHDFQIGHSYFIGKNFNLKESMNKKIIPLLLEYFMNDVDMVLSILNKSGLNVEKNSWPIRIL